MDDQDDAALEQTERLISCFAVFKAVVNDGGSIQFEYCKGILHGA